VAEGSYPAFPPGFWRAIVVQPGNGWIGAALEDEVHHFLLRLDHDGTRITGVASAALRQPWSACRMAGAHLADSLEGAALADVAARDAKQECTHLLDMAMLCAAHVGDSAQTRFDMRVADREPGDAATSGVVSQVGGRTSAAIDVDGIEQFRWQLTGTAIDSPEPWAGRDLRQLSSWKHEFPADQAECATLLRRALFVSGVRQFAEPAGGVAANSGLSRMGVCYNYQPPQVESSTPTYDRRDFVKLGTRPLAAFASHELETL
jgi:hypothetical protein